MATIENSYTGDGSTTLFSFTFPYISEVDVTVSVDSVLQTLETEYIFANATTINFLTAPADGAAILIRRKTDSEDTKAVFFPGSSIRARDLNDNFTQTLYVIQESVDQATTAANNATQAAADAATAQTAATDAAADAAEALTAANTAQNQVGSAATDAAAAAQSAADAASQVAGAQQAADDAEAAALQAQSDAAQASADAAAVTGTAANALTAAQSAETKADQAVATANNALAQANIDLPNFPVLP